MLRKSFLLLIEEMGLIVLLEWFNTVY